MLVCLFASVVAGCAATASIGESVEGLFVSAPITPADPRDATAPAPGSTPRTAFAVRGGVEIRRRAAGEAEVVGKLARHEEVRAHQVVEGAVRDGIGRLPDVFATAVDAVRGDRGWVVRAEVVGPRLPGPKEVRTIEAGARAACGEPVSVSLLARAEVVVDAKGYGPVGVVR